MRGKVFPTWFAAASLGITPACAGKRRRSPSRRSIRKDHPRLCGEKFLLTSLLEYAIGSPPLVRGKEITKTRIKSFVRITPACAGKSITTLHLYFLWRDHPRLCGEKCPFSCFCHCPSGSPPLVRGKDCKIIESVTSLRITPACAGKRDQE